MMGMIMIFGGFVTGMVLMYVIIRFKSATGVIYIDHSNPEKDSFLFDIKHIDNLYHKRRVVLRIDCTDKSSH